MCEHGGSSEQPATALFVTHTLKMVYLGFGVLFSTSRAIANKIFEKPKTFIIGRFKIICYNDVLS